MSKETKETVSEETVSEETVESKETVSKETVGDEETVEISPRTGKPIDKRKSHRGNGKGRGKNSPVIGMNGYDLEAGDNTKIVGVNMALFNLPDIDLYNEDQVAERLNEYFKIYFEADMKPTVAGMALCLNGMSRRTLIGIVNDYGTGGDGYKSALPRSVTLLIKKAYKLLETSWESYMNAGKLNPVTGIFLAKNNYGYQDKTEYVLTPNAKQEEEYSADEIRERYIAADQQKRLSQSDFGTDETSD